MKMKKMLTVLIATLFFLAPAWTFARDDSNPADNDMKVKAELEVIDDADEPLTVDRIMMVDIQNIKTFFPGAETGVKIITGHEGFTQVNPRLLFDAWFSLWLGGEYLYNAQGDEFAGVSGKWKLASKQAVCDILLAQLWESSGRDRDEVLANSLTKIGVEMLYDWDFWVAGLDAYYTQDSNNADASSIEPFAGIKTPYGLAYLKVQIVDSDETYEDEITNKNAILLGFVSTF